MRWKKNRTSPWVSWEADQPGMAPRRGTPVIKGETVPPETPSTPPPLFDPVEQIITDYGERRTSSPQVPPPPPSWGRPTPQAADQHSQPRMPAAQRPDLRPVRVRRLPAPPWWVLPAAWTWSRRQAPRTVLLGAWATLIAAGALAAGGSWLGLATIAGLRWELAALVYAALAGIAARLFKDVRRLGALALVHWVTFTHWARNLSQTN